MGDEPLKVIKASRATNAEEWAMREAGRIVDKHIDPQTNWDLNSALVCDIAESLTGVRRATMSFHAQPGGSDD